MEPIQIIRVGNTLGEGVQWDALGQALWWTDIQERKLYRYDWARQALESFSAPERVGSFGLIQGRSEIIAAFESGFALFDPRSGAQKWLARPDAAIAGLRFNDGRVDRQGRFWAGTMDETEPRSARANLYCVDAAGRAVKRESGIMISNGICWSPDSKRFYFADSPLQKMYCYDFDPLTGAIANRRVFAETTGNAHPDGACVDAQGYLWSAQWGAGQVARYAPDGTIERILKVPASQPTCVAFGGPDLDLLFVTCARDGLTAGQLAHEPSAGDVFVYKMGCIGLAENHFVLDMGRRRDVEPP
ncbi:MAG TPA: SMP-30/gluconolactonase/LRE family protein [Rhizomicrobium sp.]|nr:SMP-30/gluconolactonase/LRE family protein [Rhizomicrobium sp.]